MLGNRCTNLNKPKSLVFIKFAGNFPNLILVFLQPFLALAGSSHVINSAQSRTLLGLNTAAPKCLNTQQPDGVGCSGGSEQKCWGQVKFSKWPPERKPSSLAAAAKRIPARWTATSRRPRPTRRSRVPVWAALDQTALQTYAAAAWIADVHFCV